MTPATRRSEFELSVLVAVPVLLGSLMRIPLGVLTDRYGGRRVFLALLAFTPGPLVGLALWHDSYAGLLALGLLLGFAGASFAVGVPFVSRWYAPGRQGFAPRAATRSDSCCSPVPRLCLLVLRGSPSSASRSAA